MMHTRRPRFSVQVTGEDATIHCATEGEVVPHMDRVPRTSAFPVAWVPGPMLDASPETDTLERSAGR